ncbi:MAG: cysteine--tRNA ligase [Candidatus Aenigmarchaeota archaeon]|nr:cysteine--tRNA ligase [Candidatus Aenigmarchaeota archaeon]
MPIKIFNTLTKKKEIFEPINKNKVTMFVCGPTVYDHSHLGHARTYIAYDIITRYLRYRGFNLFFLMNITDDDDKIIKRSKERSIEPTKLAREFEQSFYEDMKTLNVLSTVNVFARASEHIKEIISQIQRLIDKSFAYVSTNGVYYDITKFEDYGKLSHQDTEQLEKHRIEPDSTKRNPQDFALWKFEKQSDLSWDSPWGRGRPGWHIQDTAIAEKYLGQQYDIHGGGLDLIFPHHESEIAQMESLSGKKPMVKYWTHTGFLMVNGEKMAKSLGNFVFIKDALKKFDAETLRLFFAFTHYRSPIDFTEKNLEQSKKSLDRLYTTLENVHSMKATKNITLQEKQFDMRFLGYKQKFIDAMDDDFNTLEALKVLFKMSNEVNKFITHRKELNKDVKENILNMFRELGGIFGILQKEIKKEELSDDIKKLVDEREEARKKKDWKTADEIRIKLNKMGVTLEDTPEGIKWKIKK